MTPEIDSLLFFAGTNLSFAVQAFITFNKDTYDLNKLLKFTEEFINAQMDDFDNWCEEIMMAMPDEDEEDEPSHPSN